MPDDAKTPVIDQIKADMTEIASLKDAIATMDANTSDDEARALVAAQAVIDAAQSLKDAQAAAKALIDEKRRTLTIATAKAKARGA